MACSTLVQLHFFREHVQARQLRIGRAANYCKPPVSASAVALGLTTCHNDIKWRLKRCRILAPCVLHHLYSIRNCTDGVTSCELVRSTAHVLRHQNY